MNQIIRRTFRLLLPLSLLFSGCASRLTGEQGEGKRTAITNQEPVRISAEGADSSEPAIALAPDGPAYVAWVEHRGKDADVMLARVGADGRAQETIVRVNAKPGEATAWRGDPPTVAVAKDGTVYVGWSGRGGSGAHDVNIYLSASRDAGKSFGPAVKVNDDEKPGDHGMHSLAVSQDGKVYVAWLDERNVAKPHPSTMTQEKHTESNRDAFIASSLDGGRTFSANRKVAGDICPCCKTGLVVAPDGRLYLAWRQVLPGDFRHIAVASSTDHAQSFATPVIVSDDQWVLKGCPVSGAALSVSNEGKLKVLWYAGSETSEQGVYWSDSNDGGKTFAPRRLLSSGFARSMPVLASQGENGSVAVWEASAKGTSEVQIGVPENTSLGPDALRFAGEVPAAAANRDRLLVTYVVKEDERRSVWLTSTSSIR